MIGEIANWEVLEEPSLSDHQYIEITIDSSVKNCTFTSVIEACNKSYRAKNQNLSPTPNWYTQDLEVKKNRLKELRRRAQRATRDQRNVLFQFHKEELKKYMRKLKTAQDIQEKIFPILPTVIVLLTSHLAPQTIAHSPKEKSRLPSIIPPKEKHQDQMASTTPS
ncbi:hypothetical protein AVEN_92784-1 [Araneus ventricosus]|uniref:Endonuclease/exonuclease/phosphatase domain-containing protein n=1 Tax=Araneus ventricosus TaxID=182803 RepID=A0A4Y2HI85_ARAVE|nr:hypothetical protein AVEN_92784-1 [Araneus ventricosus]